MEVVEERHYSVAIETDERKTIDELKNIAERKRVAGKLSFKGVADVDSWCDSAYAHGKEVPVEDAVAK